MDGTAPTCVRDGLGCGAGRDVPAAQVQEADAVVAVVQDEQAAVRQEADAARLAELRLRRTAVHQRRGVGGTSGRTGEGLHGINLFLGHIQEGRAFEGLVPDRHYDRIRALRILRDTDGQFGGSRTDHIGLCTVQGDGVFLGNRAETLAGQHDDVARRAGIGRYGEHLQLGFLVVGEHRAGHCLPVHRHDERILSLRIVREDDQEPGIVGGDDFRRQAVDGHAVAFFLVGEQAAVDGDLVPFDTRIGTVGEDGHLLFLDGFSIAEAHPLQEHVAGLHGNGHFTQFMIGHDDMDAVDGDRLDRRRDPVHGHRHRIFETIAGNDGLRTGIARLRKQGKDLGCRLYGLRFPLGLAGGGQKGRPGQKDICKRLFHSYGSLTVTIQVFTTGRWAPSEARFRSW